MKNNVVSLDLHHPLPTYTQLDKELRRLNCEPIHSHLWAGPADLPPEVVKSVLLEAIYFDDRIAVFTLDSTVDDYASHNPIR